MIKFRTSTANFISPSRSPPWEDKETLKKFQNNRDLLAMTKSFEAHKSKDFNQLKYLLYSNNKVIKKERSGRQSKLGSNSP